MLTVEKLSKYYGDKCVVDKVSFQVKAGEVISLLGHNGAGKTTTVKMAASLLMPDEGQIIWSFADQNKGLNEVKKRLGYVGQDTERSGYARLTVAENLLFFASLAGIERKRAKQDISKWAAAFTFTEALHKPFTTLSGGQKQIMVIIRALLHHPAFLILDEPTKGLDPVKAGIVRKILYNYVHENGKGMILTSHIMKDVEVMSDKVALMKAGKICYLETVREIDGILGYRQIVELGGKRDWQRMITSDLKGLDFILLKNKESNRLLLGTNDALAIFRVVYFMFMASLISYNGDIQLEGRYMIIFFCASFLMFSFFSATLKGPLNTVEKDLYNGTLEYIYLMPTKRFIYYFGTGIANAIHSLVFFLPIYIFIVVYSHCSPGAALWVLLVTFIGVVTTVGIGVLMALLGIVWRQAGAVFTVLFVLIEFLAGAYTPIQSYPLLIRGLAYLIPFTWSYDLCRFYLMPEVWRPLMPMMIEWGIYVAMMIFWVVTAFVVMAGMERRLLKRGVSTL